MLLQERLDTQAMTLCMSTEHCSDLQVRKPSLRALWVLVTNFVFLAYQERLMLAEATFAVSRHPPLRFPALTSSSGGRGAQGVRQAAAGDETAYLAGRRCRGRG
jgi:hypothetical protein